MDALSSGAAPAVSTDAGAKAIGSYLDGLGGASNALTGGGMTSYLDTVSSGGTAIGSAPAVKSYLDALAAPSSPAAAAPAAPSAPVIKGYLDALASGTAQEDSPGAGIMR